MTDPYLVVSFYDRKPGKSYGYSTLVAAYDAYDKIQDIGLAYRSRYVVLIDKHGDILAKKEFHY